MRIVVIMARAFYFCILLASTRLLDFAPWQPYVVSAILCVAAAGLVAATAAVAVAAAEA